MKDLYVLIAMHKNCKYHKSYGYYPIEVGADMHKEPLLNVVKDNTGDNISKKNDIYCELTGMYWVWKNQEKAKYMGLVHYRRYFVKKINLFKDNNNNILDIHEIESILNKYAIIIPRPRKKKKGNGRLIKDLPDSKQDKALIITRDVILKYAPEYINDFNSVTFGDAKVSFGNMFISSGEVFQEYCTWVFNILSLIEEEYDIVPPRMLGFISEYLLYIWVKHNYETNEIYYCDVINTEDKNIKNWAKSIVYKFM